VIGGSGGGRHAGTSRAGVTGCPPRTGLRLVFGESKTGCAAGQQYRTPSDVAGVYGAGGAGLASAAARAPRLTNQRARCSELSGAAGRLMANVDLSGLAIR